MQRCKALLETTTEEYEEPLEAEKGKKVDFPRELPENIAALLAPYF